MKKTGAKLYPTVLKMASHSFWQFRGGGDADREPEADSEGGEKAETPDDGALSCRCGVPPVRGGAR